jgi:hypothetical protein
MIHKVRIFTMLSLVLMIMLSSSVSLNLGYAQTSDITKANSTLNPEAEALLKKIFSASSFSNIQTISFVDGIEVSGINLGDSDVTVTLRKTATENATNLSTPVTVTAVRVPGSSIKDLMALVEASAKLRGPGNTGPLAAMLTQMGGLLNSGSGLNATNSLAPIQAIMQLGQNTQMGVANIVGGNWSSPRTATTGLLDLAALFGMGNDNPSPDARAHFIMIFVVPYVGKTSFGSVPLH